MDTQNFDPKDRTALVHRLRRVSGQLDGIVRLIENGVECETLVQQLAASRKALDRAYFMAMGCALMQVQAPAESQQNSDASAAQWQSVVELFTRNA